MLTGEEFDAAEAHRIGLIQEVLADGASLGLSRRSRSGRHSAPIIGTATTSGAMTN
jgi:enoyl-CoA hydratase/carnithine racemase